MPELLSRVDVGQVHLDERQSRIGNRVTQRDAVVSEGARVHDDARGVRRGFLQVVHDGAFVVRLEEVQLHAERFRALAEARLNVGKRVAPVLGGIAHTEPIQIRAVHDKYLHGTHTR